MEHYSNYDIALKPTFSRASDTRTKVRVYLRSEDKSISETNLRNKDKGSADWSDTAYCPRTLLGDLSGERSEARLVGRAPEVCTCVAAIRTAGRR